MSEENDPTVVRHFIDYSQLQQSSPKKLKDSNIFTRPRSVSTKVPLNKGTGLGIEFQSFAGLRLKVNKAIQKVNDNKKEMSSAENTSRQNIKSIDKTEASAPHSKGAIDLIKKAMSKLVASKMKSYYSVSAQGSARSKKEESPLQKSPYVHKGAVEIDNESQEPPLRRTPFADEFNRESLDTVTCEIKSVSSASKIKSKGQDKVTKVENQRRDVFRRLTTRLENMRMGKSFTMGPDNWRPKTQDNFKGELEKLRKKMKVAEGTIDYLAF